MPLNSFPIVFATENDHKFVEARRILKGHNIRIRRSSFNSKEIQSLDTDEIVREKVISAFVSIGRPLIVEHTSLHLDYVNGFPSGFTAPFLTSLGDDRVCDLFGESGRNTVTAETKVAYCDGREIKIFAETMRGSIPLKPSGKKSGWAGFGWSRVFVPDGFANTLSELGISVKNKISMRAKALALFAKFLSRPK